MSSGASTPRVIPSPAPGAEPGGQPPASGGSPPLTVGMRFVKQYYQTLTSKPDEIHRFYQPASVLSDGEGSRMADPVTFESTYEGESEKLKDRFFVKDLQIRFDFDYGAIDAQESINGGIVLVVTAHVVYYPSASEDEDAAVDDPIRKGFVHTFFLNPLYSGTKKNYYVHNDILRFLKNPAEVSPSISEAAEIENEPVAVPPADTKPAEPVVAETKAPPSPTKTQTRQTPAKAAKPAESATIISVKEVVEEAPGGGVEETKEDVLPEVDALAAAKPTKEEKGSKKDGKGAKEDKDGAKEGKVSPKTKPQEAQDGAKTPAPPSPAPKPTPSSWASMAARPAAPSSAVKAPSPAAGAKAPPKPVATTSADMGAQTANDKKDNNNNNSNNKMNAGGQHKMGNNNNLRGDRPPKRDPDCTLVIKNLADGTKESEVLALFEPFASQTGSKIVGITVSAHRNLAFVDYDSVHPVNKAVELHAKEPMRLLGRVLEVDQKTAEQRARRVAQQGGGRVAQQGGGRGGGGGGNRRGRDGGRGDRGGGGRGGGRGGRY